MVRKYTELCKKSIGNLIDSFRWIFYNICVACETLTYYYAIGGAVKIGEKASDAAVREVYEESGLKVEIDRLVLVQENFFELEDGMHHELAFYYLMKDIGEQKVAGDRVLDCSEEGLEWIDLEKMSEYKIYPKIYNDILKDIPTEIIHSVVDDRKITR